MENNAKKVFLSVLGVAILLVAVIGVSFAAFNYSNVGGANSISTGSITMSYSEAFAGILLEDALPIADDAALAANAPGPRNSFEFTVSSAATGDDTITVPYTITVTPTALTGDVLTNDQVKIALFKNGGTTPVVGPVKIDALADSTVRVGSKVLYAPEDGATNTLTDTVRSVTDSYVLKIWVASDVKIEEQLTVEKEYKLLVNVDSTVENLK